MSPYFDEIRARVVEFSRAALISGDVERITLSERLFEAIRPGAWGEFCLGESQTSLFAGNFVAAALAAGLVVASQSSSLPTRERALLYRAAARLGLDSGSVEQDGSVELEYVEFLDRSLAYAVRAIRMRGHLIEGNEAILPSDEDDNIHGIDAIERSIASGEQALMAADQSLAEVQK